MSEDISLSLTLKLELKKFGPVEVEFLVPTKMINAENIMAVADALQRASYEALRIALIEIEKLPK